MKLFAFTSEQLGSGFALDWNAPCFNTIWWDWLPFTRFKFYHPQLLFFLPDKLGSGRGCSDTASCCAIEHANQNPPPEQIKHHHTNNYRGPEWCKQLKASVHITQHSRIIIADLSLNIEVIVSNQGWLQFWVNFLNWELWKRAKFQRWNCLFIKALLYEMKHYTKYEIMRT